MMALRQIRKAQATYKEKQGNYGSIDDLIAAKLIDSKMANKEFYGYSLSTGQKKGRNLLYDIKRSEQMASLLDQNDDVELWS